MSRVATKGLSDIPLPSSCGDGKVLYRGYAAFYQYADGRWKSDRQNDTRIYIVKIGDGHPWIVGVSCKNEVVVLNTWVYRTMELWHQNGSHFVQWHDKKSVYGLSFEDEGSCAIFVLAVEKCVAMIREAQAKEAQAGGGMGSLAATRTQIEKAKGGQKGGGGGGFLKFGRDEKQSGMTQQDANRLMEEHKIEPIKLKKPEGMRDHKAFEIYMSEVAYCDTLSRIVYMCKIPVEQSGLLTGEQLNQMFSNVQEIFDYNCKFLKKLEAAYAEWDQTTKIGHIFDEILVDIQVYAPYFKNYEEIPKLLDQLAKSKKTAQWLEGPQVQEATKGHGLTHLLIQPCQRLMRYVMLVNELVKETTEEHPDCQALKDALAGLQKAAASMNESVRESENQKFLAHITLNPNTYIGFDVIIEPTRVLLSNLACTVSVPSGSFGHVYIFNDLVVFCELIEEKKQTKQRVAETLKMDQIWVHEVDPKTAPFALKLITPENHYVVQLPNLNDQKTFTDQMNQAVEKICVKVLDKETGRRNIEINFQNGDRYHGEVLNAVLDGKGTFDVACGNRYTGDMVNGKFTGEGEMIYGLGGISACRYTGTWKDDLYDGEGTLEFEGSKYVGSWVMGRKEGQGTITFPTGATYKGEWLKDLQHGKGVFYSPSTNESYEGDWKEGNFHGYGVLHWPMGKYEGEFVNDFKEGKGKLKAITVHGLEYYDGEWKNDARHGHGVLTRCGRRKKQGGGKEEYTVFKYEGDWVEGSMAGEKGEVWTEMIKFSGKLKDGKMEGENCVVEFKDGSRYEGALKNDQKQGAGKMIYPNGDVYEGAFHINQKYGRGKLVSEKWSYDGAWLSDEMSKGTLVFPTGAKYSGNYQQSRPHGSGVFEYEKVKYVGEWEGGLPGGSGTLTIGDFSTLESGWKEGKPEGKGTYKNIKGGYKFVGEYENGQRSGDGKVILEKTKEEIEVNFQHGSILRPTIDQFPPPPPTPLFIVK